MGKSKEVLFITSHEVAFMTCFALSGDKDPAADGIQLPLARAQPGEWVAGVSCPCRSYLMEVESWTERELYWVLLVAQMQGSSHACGRSL